MGRTKELKKIRKEARKNAEQVYKEFVDSFDLKEYLIDKPFWIPQFIWNFIIRLIVKQK